MKNITIIVPIYGDLSSLQKCIASLIQCVDKKHTIMLVNDCGPECDIIENKIDELIKHQGNFKYYRNTKNIGFVKTCNKAVFELDNTDNDILLLNSDTVVTKGFLEEMQYVLYICEKHGVVCPRSNNATILSIPRQSNGRPISPIQSHELFLRLQEYLPRYSVLPTGVGFAFLVKRKIIDSFGLFDEVYGKGYNEENDFCQRINQYGYSVVSANRAFVFHEGTRSFNKKVQQKNDKENLIKLCERYPYYLNTVRDYFERYINPIEYYADLCFDGIYEKKRVLFSLYDIPSAYNGTSHSAIQVLTCFEQMFKNKYDIHILINREADIFWGISKKYPNVWHPDDIEGTYHVAYTNSQIFNMEHLLILNRVALKYIVCIQDIISVRSTYILCQYPERYDVFYKSIEYADGITSISNFSMEDTMAYYKELIGDNNKLYKTIYLAADERMNCACLNGTDVPFEDYFFVYGNRYKHKFVDDIMPFIKEMPYNFVVLGTDVTGKLYSNVYGYRSGNIETSELDYIISKSKGLIFPSVYEGFGLPILDSIRYKKRIAVNRNQLNCELKETFDKKSNKLLYDNMRELQECISNIYNDNVYCYSNDIYKRSWDDVAKEVETVIEEVLLQEINKKRLLQRWNDLKYVERRNSMPRYESTLSFRKKFALKFPQLSRRLVNLKRSVLKQ